MYLFYPQWQGSGSCREIHEAALLIKNKLVKSYTFDEVDLSIDGSQTEHLIQNYKSLIYNLKQCNALLKNKAPETVFTLGGDCSTDIGPIDYLNRKHRGISIIWIDAHADLNTPSSSPSKTLHGMALRALLGEGDKGIVKNITSRIYPKDLFLVGVRDMDSQEKGFVSKNNIALMNSEVLQKNLSLYTDEIIKNTRSKVYIHIDMDVIDPKELENVCVPTAKGLSIYALLRLLKMLRKNKIVVGGSILEYTKGKRKDMELIERTFSKLCIK